MDYSEHVLTTIVHQLLTKQTKVSFSFIVTSFVLLSISFLDVASDLAENEHLEASSSNDKDIAHGYASHCK